MLKRYGIVLDETKDAMEQLAARAAVVGAEWAAELAPSYAPELKPNLIGAAFGGTLVSPEHNLTYIEGAPIWGGVMPMAVIGVSRSYEIDIQKYLTARGLEVYDKMQKASIAYVLGQYTKVTWKDLVKPEYLGDVVRSFEGGFSVQAGEDIPVAEYVASLDTLPLGPILADLGVTSMRLMTNNPAKYGGLGGYDLEVVERVPLNTVPTPENEAYLRTKRERMGHLIDLEPGKQVAK